MARSWAETECRRRCWAVSTVSGGFVAFPLWAFAHMPAGIALGVGAGLMLALGWFLGWAFCTSSRGYRAADAAAAPESGAPLAAGQAAGGGPTGVGPADPTTDARPAWAGTGSFAQGDAAPDQRAPPSDAPHAAGAAGSSAGSIAGPVAGSIGPLLQARPVDETLALRPGAAKPVARRTADETGILGAVQRTHLRPSPVVEPLAAGQGASSGFQPLDRPRGGVADDLKLIRGIGPALEQLLNAQGVWHFDQIAAWKARDIAAVDARLGRFYGRITRDGWVRQARILAAAGPGALNGAEQPGAAPGIATGIDRGIDTGIDTGPASAVAEGKGQGGGADD
jgi:NADH-quinone oxidoreductase subunit E